MSTATLEQPGSAVARPLSVPDAAEVLGIRLDRFRLLMKRHRAATGPLFVIVGGRRQIDPTRLPELRQVLGLPPE